MIQRGAAEVRQPGLPRSARAKLASVIRGVLCCLGLLLLGLGPVAASLQHELSRSGRDLLPAAAAADRAREAMDVASASVRTFRTGSGGRAAARTSLDDAARALRGAEDAVGFDQELTGLVLSQNRAGTAWLTEYGRPAVAETESSAAVTGDPAANPNFLEFTRTNGEVQRYLVAAQAEVNRRTTAMLWLAIGSGASIILIGLVVILRPATRAMRHIGPPLEELHATVRRLEAGDLDARADPVRGVVEIRAVSTALNQMANTIAQRRHQEAEKLRLARAVRAINVLVADSFDIDAVLATCTPPIIASFEARGVWIRAFDGPIDLEPENVGSVFPPRSSPGYLILAARRMAERLWERQGTYVLRKGVPPDPDLMSAADAEALFAVPDIVGAATILGVPMGCGPTCVGYIAVHRTADQPEWSPSEIDALQQVAGDIGRVVLHARVYQQDQRVVAQLRELDEVKTQFVSMVSHELRTPLASIIGHLEIVQSGDAGRFDDEARPFLAAIDRNASRLTSLIEDLLLLSRIEQRAERRTLSTVEVGGVARAAIGMYAETAARRDITVCLQAEGACVVYGDETELEHVMTNLIGNAIKYSPGQTTIDVGVHGVASTAPGTAAAVEIVVSDEGWGIPAAELPKIFERFYRAPGPHTQAVPGTGLGLAITRLITERHGGTIRAESELGRGSTFTVTLPAAVVAARAEPAALVDSALGT